MHPANKRGSAEVVTLPPFVAVVVVPTFVTFGVLGAAHAVSAIETATTMATSRPDRKYFEVLNRVTCGLWSELLAHSS
jgi:hypothetical protein